MGKRVAKLLPKADFAGLVLDQGELVDVGQAAKILELGYECNNLCHVLWERGIFSSTGINLLAFM